MRQQWVGKRQAERTQVQLRGQLRFSGCRPDVDCTVTDVSRSGARLTLAEDSELPEEFDLFVFSRNETRWARLRWREKRAVGVEFLSREGVDSNLLQRLTAVEARLLQIADGASSGSAPDAPAPGAPGAAALLVALERRLEEIQAEAAERRAAAERAEAASQTAAMQLEGFAARLQGLDCFIERLDGIDDRCAELESQIAGHGRRLQSSDEQLAALRAGGEAQAADHAARPPEGAVAADPETSAAQLRLDGRIDALETAFGELRGALKALVMLTAARIKREDAAG